MAKKNDPSPEFNLTFIGHMCFDEIIPFGGEPAVAPGRAVLCGALAAARIGMRVAAVVKMAPQDRRILRPMKEAGVAVLLVPAKSTPYMRVEQLS